MFLLMLVVPLFQDDKKPSPLWEREGEAWVDHADRDCVILGQEKELVALSSRDGKQLWCMPMGCPLRYAGNGILVGEYAKPGEKIVARKTGTGERIWEFPVGKRSGTHAFAGKILVTGQDSAMSCLETETGKVCWQMPSAPVLRIAFDGRRRMFWADYAGALHAVDMNTGSEEWRVEIGEDVCDPMVTEGARLIVSTGKRMLALDAATGKIAWQYREPTTQVWSLRRRSRYDDPSPAPLADGVLLAYASGKLVGIDPATGTELWKGDSQRECLVADGRVFVTDWVDGRLGALDPRTGRERWALENPEFARATNARDFDRQEEIAYRPHAAADGRLYSSRDREVIGQDVGTGKIVWEFKCAGRVQRMLLAGSFLFVQSYDEVVLFQGSGIRRTKIVRPALYCLPTENN